MTGSIYNQQMFLYETDDMRENPYDTSSHERINFFKKLEGIKKGDYEEQRTG